MDFMKKKKKLPLKDRVKESINYENIVLDLKEIAEGKTRGQRVSIVKLRLEAIKILLDFTQK